MRPFVYTQTSVKGKQVAVENIPLHKISSEVKVTILGGSHCHFSKEAGLQIRILRKLIRILLPFKEANSYLPRSLT